MLYHFHTLLPEPFKQTSVRSTITRVGIKEKMVCSGVRGAHGRWMGEEKRDCAHGNRSSQHKLKGSVLHDSWRKYSVFALLVSGGLICMEGGLRAPCTAHCPGCSAGAGLLHYKPVWFYDARLTVMLMNALLAFTSPVSLWKWQAVHSPLPFSLKRPLHLFSSNSCSANV